jgi:long-chain acyl-CoA synthetase
MGSEGRAPEEEIINYIETYRPFETLVDLWANAVADAPSTVAIEQGSDRWTYQQVWKNAHGLARRLLTNGHTGQAVGLMVPNGIDFHVGFLGVMLAGGAPAPINPTYPADQVAGLLLAADAAVVVTDDVVSAKSDALVKKLAGLDVLRIRRDERLRSGEQINLPRPQADDRALLLFTGGTTGVPKAVVHTHRSIAAAVRGMELIWPTRPGNEVWLPVAPMSHIYGLLMGVLNPVYGVGRIVIPDRFHPDLVVEMIGRHRVTVFGGGPASVYAGILAASNLDSADFSSLRTCPAGGSPLPVDLLERWHRRTGLPIHEAYGMSEMAPIAGSSVRTGQKNGSVGRAVPSNSIEVVDIQSGDRVLRPGEIGEIRASGLSAMKGYLNNPADQALTVRAGWIYTGDTGFLDEEGFLFITGRKKEMIIVKGFNVFPRVVEEIVAGHPAIREVGLAGVPDDRSGERLVAFLVREEQVTEAELREYLSQRLAPYMVPSEFHFIDALPLTAAGKLDRAGLKCLARP